MDGSVTFKKENLPETQLTFIDLSFNQFSFLITQPSNFSDQLQGAQRYLKSYFLSFPKSKNINLKFFWLASISHYNFKAGFFKNKINESAFIQKLTRFLPYIAAYYIQCRLI
jgi:hypothetical protein